MVRGYDKNQERLKTLSLFGKTLVRRSNSRCELCQSSNVKLCVYEVAPIVPEPDLENCIFICETCKKQLDNPKIIEKNHWRRLQESVWSEIAAIQVISLRMLKKIANTEIWANKILEEVYVEDEIQDWANQITI